MRRYLGVETLDRFRDDIESAAKEWDAAFRLLCPQLTAEGVALLNRRLLHAALAQDGDIGNMVAWMRKEIPRAMAPIK